MMEDTYITISEPAHGEFKDKGSKFLAYVYNFNHEDELNNLMAELKIKHPKARHYCYAYKIGTDNNRFRINDDGEPSGTAGKPIYGQILSHQLTNVVIIVIRYFGGVKLGASGLIHAYREASREALSNASTLEKYLYRSYVLSFGYDHMGHILNVLKELDIQITHKSFNNDCLVHIDLRLSQESNLLRLFKAKVLDKSPDEIKEDTEFPFCKLDVLELH
ncbi:MAG: YigZ family protein [Saprospiraceae bacterium]|nr:YigZ family protein [Saprospiraceae bacterium]